MTAQPDVASPSLAEEPSAMNAFLLRFQEPCIADELISAGMQKKTKTRREGDNSGDLCRVFAGSSDGMKLVTQTRIARETTDLDRANAALAATSDHATASRTKTRTMIRAETADEDSRRTIPRALGTKTITTIRAETKDPHANLTIFPK